MRKTLLFAATAAMLAGCATQETVDIAPDNSIGFNTYIGKPTRADVTSSTLQTFYVYGGHDDTKVFDGMTVRKTSNGWTPEEAKYWVEGKTYNFAAMAPQVADASYDMHTLKVTDYAPGDDDLVVAVVAPVTAKAANNDAVYLNFQHALAKVQVSFLGQGNGQIQFSVSDVALVNVAEKGTLTATYGTGTSLEWENAKATGSCAYTLTDNKGVRYMLPQDLENVELSFKVSVVGREEEPEIKEFSVPVKTATVEAWEMGHAYNYTINVLSAFGLDTIEFVVVDAPDWDNINIEGTTGGGNNEDPVVPALLSNQVKIDFGPATVSEDEDNSWNAIEEVNPSNVKLYDCEGNVTSLYLSATDFSASYAGAGSEPNLPIEAAGIEWPRMVWKNSFSIDGEKENGDVGPATITISGFDPEQKVNITVLCARWNAGVDARITQFVVVSKEGKSEPVDINQGLGRGWGNAEHSAQWDAFDFETLAHTFTNVVPNEAGVIEIEVKGIDTGSAADAHISAMVINPVAE